MDLIRRQDAIDKLRDTLAEYVPYIHGVAEAIPLECIKTIMQIQSAQQWIPCSEGLPDKYVDEDGILIHYLGCDSDGDIGTGFYEPDSDEHWDVQWPACNDAYFDIRIVAWMPLPEPYKAESEEK